MSRFIKQLVLKDALSSCRSMSSLSRRVPVIFTYQIEFRISLDLESMSSISRRVPVIFTYLPDLSVYRSFHVEPRLNLSLGVGPENKIGLTCGHVSSLYYNCRNILLIQLEAELL